MGKNILTLMFIFALAFSGGLNANAMEPDADVQEQIDGSGINITVSQSTLNISGASGLTLEVVSLTGRKVATVKIESPLQRVELNIPKGCYILKIGKVVRKVSIH